MNALEVHFAHLDTDRSHDDIGPMIPLDILKPWSHADELWGQPYVRREPGGLRIWAILIGDAYDKPFARLPETMRGPGSIVLDWRNALQLSVTRAGYCYVRPLAEYETSRK